MNVIVDRVDGMVADGKVVALFPTNKEAWRYADSMNPVDIAMDQTRRWIATAFATR